MNNEREDRGVNLRTNHGGVEAVLSSRDLMVSSETKFSRLSSKGQDILNWGHS